LAPVLELARLDLDCGLDMPSPDSAVPVPINTGSAIDLESDHPRGRG